MTDAHSLVLEAVTKVFEAPEGRLVTAVDRVSLTIGQGEFVTLLGPSGCGKTTTLRLIAGFEFPTAGRILLDGKDIAHVPPDKRGMAMVFQSYALFPHMSVFENIAYGLRLRHWPKAEIERTVGEMMALVNLSGLEHRRPASLSGGQQQRVALARAMAVRPNVLLFDEPLSNLDAKLRVALRAEIRRLQKQLGITSIYVTHDQAEAMSLSDRVVVMNAGQVEQASAPAELYTRPATRFVADFIGQANFLDVAVERAAGGWAEITLWAHPMRVPAHDNVGPGPAALMLRPEAICLAGRAGACAARFQGRVRAVTFLGSAVEYEIESNGQTLTVSDREAVWGSIFAEGELVGWDFAPERGYVIP